EPVGDLHHRLHLAAVGWTQDRGDSLGGGEGRGGHGLERVGVDDHVLGAERLCPGGDGAGDVTDSWNAEIRHVGILLGARRERIAVSPAGPMLYARGLTEDAWQPSRSVASTHWSGPKRGRWPSSWPRAWAGWESSGSGKANRSAFRRRREWPRAPK